ncbi:MAG TPA: oxalate/formate MFS antiporter [Candidatus Angelobacter sp.]|nr:oxalate/formate MFS antiporter [Candidatus Angelobacter sp.]
MSKRWIQFGSALVCMIMIANLQYAWALFVKPLQAAHKDWGLVGIQAAATLFLIFETWVTPVEGWLIDRLGPRIFLTAGGILVGIGWTGMGYAATLTQLKILYSVAGIGAAFIYSGSVATALKWFPDKRGTVSGFITAGFGAGAALFIPLINLIIARSDYHKAFIYTGIAQSILIVIAAQLLHNPGPDFNVSPAAKKPISPSVRRNTEQFNSLQMLQTPHFYLLFLSFVMINTGGSMVTIQTAVVADFFKISAGAVTAALALGRLSNGAGRIFWGWISDRVGREMAMFIPYVLQSAGLIAILLVGRTSGTAFTISLIALYFIWGSMFSLFPAIIGDYYGPNNATSNYGFLYMAKGVAAIFAGWVAATFFLKFHNWNAVFYGAAAMAFVSALFILVLRFMPLPKLSRQAEPTMVPAKAG